MKRTVEPRAAVALTLALGGACVGLPGGEGPEGPAGPSGLAAWEVVRVKQTLKPTTGHNFRVKCPAGKTAVGGGWFGASDTIFIYASTPYRGEWLISVGHSFGMMQEIEVAAVCARVGAGTR